MFILIFIVINFSPFQNICISIFYNIHFLPLFSSTNKNEQDFEFLNHYFIASASVNSDSQDSESTVKNLINKIHTKAFLHTHNRLTEKVIYSMHNGFNKINSKDQPNQEGERPLQGVSEH